ncbi:MAG: transketolase [Defluviitaleaceae bacterium]|nr:transketolase [Defluviitaleaceae bacterium]
MAYSKDLLQSLKEKSQQLRKNVVLSMGVGNAGHLGGSFSSADLVSALYFHKMKHDPKNPKMPDRDRFLLSKGHVAILQYSALAEAGYFPKEELNNTKALGSMLQGHPDVLKTPGIEAGTGSLGQGLSIGLGIALGVALDGLKSRVYVLCGDGELAEGQIWEAAMAAAAFKTDNLVALVDKNGMQAQGAITDRFNIGNIAKKWEAFGWHVIEIDGHNMEEILTALDEAETVKDKPKVIIATTIKGKGVSVGENHPVGFHNAPLSEQDYKQALAELTL